MSKRSVSLTTPFGSSLVDDEKCKRQEKQRFYEQRRRQELNDSLDALKTQLASKFRISSQSLASKRAVVDAAIKMLQLLPTENIPQDTETLMLLSSARPTTTFEPTSHSSPRSHRTSSSEHSAESEEMELAAAPHMACPRPFRLIPAFSKLEPSSACLATRPYVSHQSAFIPSTPMQMAVKSECFDLPSELPPPQFSLTSAWDEFLY